eukprot:12311023-Alexandrium_andersonii.AAC.1
MCIRDRCGAEPPTPDYEQRRQPRLMQFQALFSNIKTLDSARQHRKALGSAWNGLRQALHR